MAALNPRRALVNIAKTHFSDTLRMVKILLIIVAIHAVLIGFGLVFAGVMALAEPTDEELEATRKVYESERQKNRWRAIYLYSSRYRYRGLSMAMAHWPHRPECRRLIYGGIVCLAVAAALGYHLGAFNS